MIPPGSLETKVLTSRALDRLQVIKKALEEYPSLFSFELASPSLQDVTRCVEKVHSREYLNYLSHTYDD
jgi:hypothetical protein